MARKGGNPNIAKHGFKKGFDPKRNLKGAPKKTPLLETLMSEIMGVEDGKQLTDSNIGKMVKAMFETATDKKNRNQAAMAKEILDRMFGKARQTIDVNASASITWEETKTYDPPSKK